jgi:cytochrome b subunit of formate dehydrogenase
VSDWSAFAVHLPETPMPFRTLILITGCFLVSSSSASDPDNCLYCHQFRGLGRIDADLERAHIYYVNPTYNHDLLGPHARLACTACHVPDEVRVIPHKPTTPVDCTRTCHLTSEQGNTRTFSHEPAAKLLTTSVHSPETFGKLQFDEGPLLDPGQSDCLYCHDEPMFRSLPDLANSAGHAMGREIGRCDGCHTTQVPLDSKYYTRHVTSRMGRLREPLAQAQVCAACHASDEVRGDFELENAVASFVRSFHGKAVLLGDQHSADCVSCHVGANTDPHHILAHTNPQSSVHPDQIANTCRSIQCHPGADPALSTAGVHLDLPTAQGTIEFWLAFGFIVLTVLTFGPSLVMCLLEQFQIVIGRHAPTQDQPRRTVEALLKHPEGRSRLKRFTISQRWQHWILALLFIALVVTGFPMKFAHQDWSKQVVNTLGGLGNARFIHHWAGVLLVAGFVGHAIYALFKTVGNAFTITANGKRMGLFQAIWQMPMLIQPSDLIKMNLYLLYLFGLRREPPTFGRFTIKEKFEYIGVFWGTVLLGVTGALLWGEQFFSQYIDGRMLNIALIAHTYEAFLAVIHVGILHIVNVTISPHVFPLSLATITGDTPAGELAEQHSDFVEDIAKDLGVTPPKPEGHA